MNDGFEIVKMDYKVKIACIPEKLERNILLEIFKLFLDNRTRFISYTKSCEEVSIILDDYSMDISDLGNIDTINIEPTIYKVLQIFECSSGIDHVGIVASLSKFFSGNHIPILYLNTYNNNYILYPESLEKTVDSVISGSKYKNEI